MSEYFEWIDSFFGSYGSNIRYGFAAGMIGLTLSLTSRNDHPDLKTHLLLFVTTGILSPSVYIFSGIWVSEDLVKGAIAAFAGFGGRPFLRGCLNIIHMFSNQPLKIAKEVADIIKGLTK